MILEKINKWNAGQQFDTLRAQIMKQTLVINAVNQSIIFVWRLPSNIPHACVCVYVSVCVCVSVCIRVCVSLSLSFPIFLSVTLLLIFVSLRVSVCSSISTVHIQKKSQNLFFCFQSLNKKEAYCASGTYVSTSCSTCFNTFFYFYRRCRSNDGFNEYGSLVYVPKDGWRGAPIWRI